MSRLFRTTAFLAVALLAQAAHAQSASVTWTGKDAQGNAVTIPSDKVTILAFLRPGQAQTDDAIKSLTALQSRKEVQVLAVVSGDDAATLAQSLAKARWTAPIIIDADYALSGKLAVKVWPTTAILSPKGVVAGHMGGLPATYSNDLGAYVDFAAGKIDQAALTKALANRAVVAESTDERAGRHVEVALRLATRGMAEESKAELAKALDLKPTDGAVLLTIARVHLVIKNPQAAVAVLGQIRDGATAGELNVMRGWAAVEMEQWADAKKILSEAVQLNPDPSEAYYLLGRVAEHDGDAARAAECYRKAFERSESGKQMGAK
jgi:tetratricopeptide (TPR) repeat protein